MFKRLISAGAAVIAALTSACEDGPATVPGGWRSAAAWSSMVHASASGALWLDVHGHPFAAAEGVADAAAAAMTNQLVGRQLAFTARRDQAGKPDFRVVLVFNPPANADPRDLCAGVIATAAAADPGDKITVLAAFCDQSGLLSSVQGWVAKVGGPHDPRFRRLLGQVTRDLFGTP
ncbi:hypothetical protein [Magnetospirillum sulfuroxidans]|uniref:Uncharacterized protein n=1 Tax=Magnetospirillum sulfuroxidans TaxID=611300 RepID=A0ABS5IEW1_9PROT|nr:hypothetical protein [Magnetospirillum sulfuroxidans]MBR9972939.1 hypothetical protein [Magnetospirillum sulfuroxidans]